MRGARGQEADDALRGVIGARTALADARVSEGKDDIEHGGRGAVELLHGPPPREHSRPGFLAALLPAASKAEVPDVISSEIGSATGGAGSSSDTEKARLLYLRALSRYDQDRFEDAAEDLRAAL